MFRELVNKLGVFHSCRLAHTPLEDVVQVCVRLKRVVMMEERKDGWGGTEGDLITWDPWCCPWRGLMLWTT